MSSVSRRIALLEATQEETVERFQRQPLAVQRRVLDACAARLAAAGHLRDPPVEMALFRQQQPEAFRTWYRAIISSQDWFDRHHAALVPHFFAAVREEMPYAL